MDETQLIDHLIAIREQGARHEALQQATNAHLARLNGSVAEHQEDIEDLKEGAVKHATLLKVIGGAVVAGSLGAANHDVLTKLLAGLVQ